MTVAATITKRIYEGNGLAVTFAVPFALRSSGQIHCRVMDEKGAEREVTDFNVSFTPGLTVTYPLSGPPLPAGQRLIIYRDTPIIQEIDLLEGGPFHAETHEYEFDYGRMIDQELHEKISRAIIYPMGTKEEEIKNAYEFRDEINKIKDDAIAAAWRAEEAAGWSEAVKLLPGQTVNVRRSWQVFQDYAPGDLLPLPAWYFPKRAMMELRYNGFVCVPVEALSLSSDYDYQYEEAGEADTLSNAVRINFAVKAGDWLDVWVLASLTNEQWEEWESISGRVSADAEKASAAAASAEAAANEAREIAAESKLAGQAVNQRLAWAAQEDYQPGDRLALPAFYFPGRAMLYLSYNSFPCVPVEAFSEEGDYQYQEVGEAGELSHEVIVNFPIEAGDLLDVWIISSLTEQSLLRLEQAAEEASTAAESAQEGAGRAESAAEDLEAAVSEASAAQSAAENARDAAQEAADWADSLKLLAGQTVNIRKSWQVSEEYEAGDTLELPASYFPGRAMLELRYNDFICVPAGALPPDSESAYQYEEVGEINTLSNQVKVDFDIHAGDWLDIWILSSVTQEQWDALAEAASAAAAAQAGAESAQSAAEEAAYRAALTASCPLTAFINGPITAEADVTVPAYTTGSNRLEIFLDGFCCLAGEDEDSCQYRETGSAGDVSTVIRFYDSYDESVIIMALSWG